MTTITINWDAEPPAEELKDHAGRAKPGNQYSDEAARDYIAKNLIRVDRIGRDLWFSAGVGVNFAGVFDIKEAIHRLRPLDRRSREDEKYNPHDTTPVMGADQFKANRSLALDQNDSTIVNIKHKGPAPPVIKNNEIITTANDRWTSHGQLALMFVSPGERNMKDLEQWRMNCLGYMLQKRGGNEGNPHRLSLQSQTFNNVKFDQRSDNDIVSNISTAWAEVLRLTLQRLLPN
jgi:hypothetical protein